MAKYIKNTSLFNTSALQLFQHKTFWVLPHFLHFLPHFHSITIPPVHLTMKLP